MSALEVRELRVRLGGRVILEVDALDITDPALCVITGTAGSGKTALVAALAGELEASGRVLLGSHLLQGPPSARRRAGLAAAVRDGSRVTGCTVLEALRFAAGRGPRAAAALERFPQLGSRRALDAGLLSGGEQQLLQIACAWAATPAVLVLDSPTVGLAAAAATDVAALAAEEVARGAAVLWTEQDARAAPAPAAYSLVKGRLVPAAASSPAAG